MLRTHLLALFVTAGALAVSGCGKSSTTTTATSASAQPTTAASTSTVAAKVQSGQALTHAELIAAAEPICAHLNAQLAATPVQLKSVQDLQRALPLAAADERTEYIELSKLVPPASMAKDWRKFLDGTRHWAEDSAKLAALVSAKELKRATPVGTATKVTHEKLTQVAKRNGFKECALL